MVYPSHTLSIKEYEEDLGDGITVESWFLLKANEARRTEIYRAEKGFVVAYQECVFGVIGKLYVDKSYIELYKDEDSLNTILKYAGVHDLEEVIPFTLMGGL